jgi:hypothetical protein
MLRSLKVRSAGASACCSAAPLNPPGGRRLIRRPLEVRSAARSALVLAHRFTIRRLIRRLIRRKIRPFATPAYW